MTTRSRIALGAAAFAVIGTVATAVPALAITTPACSDPQANEYVQLINDPDDDGTFTPVQCFANGGTWTGSIPGIEGVTTGNNAIDITYVDSSGQHTTSFESGVDTQLGQTPVEVTAVTIR